MEKSINKILSEYFKKRELSLEIIKEYKKGIIKSNDIVLDVELLKAILSNLKIEKKEGYDYDCYNYISPSFRFYISENIHTSNDIDLNFTYLLTKYNVNNSRIFKFTSIFHELVKEQKLNVKEPSFTKYNSDEIKIFSKFLIYCINNNDKINFDNFIYVKCIDLEKLKNIEFPKSESKFVELLQNFGEILKIFDEIYLTKLFPDLENEIIEYDKIRNNKLFITEKEKIFKIQINIKKEYYKDIIDLIKRIKKYFKDIEIILYIGESFNDFYSLFKEGLMNVLIIKNPENKNLIMLKDNKDLFIFYDNENDSSYQIVENEFKDINNLLSGYFETLYLVYVKDYKIHKIKITLDLSNFGFFIKDKVMQNYFKLSEYKEEKQYYSIYLYSKNNKLCFNIFCLIEPFFSKILSIWLKYGNKEIKNNIDSLILINSYELMLKSIEIHREMFYKKIILQVNRNDKYEEEFNKALKKINIEFHTKNIYYVNSIKDYIDEYKHIPTTKLSFYNKRGFNILVPFFDFIYKKCPILNKKPIILQVSYFLSYKLNVYGIENKLDK